MIGDMEANKTLSLIVTELFLRGWKLNVSLILIPKSSKYLNYNTKHNAFYHEKRKLQQIEFTHLSDICFKDFMKLYEDCTKKPYSFLVYNTTVIK